jgi:predicted Fe-Mo cluster-binding NifX family protein
MLATRLSTICLPYQSIHYIHGVFAFIPARWMLSLSLRTARSQPRFPKNRKESVFFEDRNQSRRRHVKIAFTTSGDTLDAPLDRRFGRASKFILYDLENNSFEVIDNRESLDTPQGAGVQAAETVVRVKAGCVVTGHCGPNAYRALRQAGIAIFSCREPTVEEALNAFRSGALKPMQSSDVKGHQV